MKIGSIALASALTLGLAALASGCGASNPSPSTTTPAANVKSGGTLTVAESPSTNVDWYIPIVTASTDTVNNGSVINQIFQPLIYLNDQYKIVWSQSVASNITYNKAGTVYHVFIGKKWKWSNGQPVTAADLMFTWHVIKAASANNAPAPWPYVGVGTGDVPNGIKSVVENNAHEVTFTLDKPANAQWFIYNGLIQMTPMPVKVLDPDGSNWAKEIQYLGSIGSKPSSAEQVSDGPFILTSATPNQSWILKRNPLYSGHKAKITKLEFVYQASNTSEFTALKTGQVDIGYLDSTQLGSKSQLTALGDKIWAG